MKLTLTGATACARTLPGSSPSVLCAAVLAVLLCGCSGIKYTTSESVEDHATNIAPGETVSVMLGRYRQCKGEKPECTEVQSEGNEQGFERCVTASLRENWSKRNRYLQRSTLDVLSSGEFRRAAFPGAQSAALPRTPKTIIEQLHDPDFAQRVNAVHVRYLVLLDAETTSGGAKLDGGGGMGFLAIGATSRTRATITATVVDMRDGVESGVAMAESSGESGAGVAGYVIPFIPIFIVGSPENEACNELGRRVAQRFFSVADGVQLPR